MPNDECRMNDEIRMTRRASRSPVRHLSIPAYFVIRHPSLVIHNHNLRSRTPFDATMLYLSFICSSGRRSTVPPAFSTRSQTAAITHIVMPLSLYGSHGQPPSDPSPIE